LVGQIMTGPSGFFVLSPDGWDLRGGTIAVVRTFHTRAGRTRYARQPHATCSALVADSVRRRATLRPGV